MIAKVPITVTVNGRTYEREVPPRLQLADFLREDLFLTGTHVGCEHGICGACTVMMDGGSVRSCLTFAVQANGREITTVEGLGTSDDLSPLQQAFREHHALQCGFCTPGMLMSAVDLMQKGTPATEDAVRDALSGNLCRCTGYENIVKAVLAAMQAAGADAVETGAETRTETGPESGAEIGARTGEMTDAGADG